MTITIREAQERVLSQVTAIEDVEPVALDEALGRTLANDATGDVDVPAFDNSAMDGYAVRADDVADASAAAPVKLPVVGVIPAGSVPDAPLEPGRACRIFTGAPMPQGADTVVMQEDTEAREGAVLIRKSAPLGRNVRLRGEDLRAGQVVLSKGTVLRPQELGVLASAGHARVAVVRAPRVAILSTGTELVGVEETPGLGQVRNSNRHTLAALVREAGGVPVIGDGVDDAVRDTLDATQAAMEAASRDADVIVTSGGVSVGDYDLVLRALEGLGWREVFYKVRMKPGHPTAAGFLGDKLFFGLPGNPVSVMVTFLQFVAPALRAMLGHAHCLPQHVDGVLDQAYKGRGDREHLVPCRLVPTERGPWRADIAGAHGSGILTSLSRAQGLVVVPTGTTHLPAGQSVRVQTLRQ